MTLNLSGGALQFSVRRNGAVLVNVTTRTRYDDGQRHTVAVTVDGSGARLHAGGRVVFETASHAFFGSVSGLTALSLGGNLDSDHPSGEWFYTGTIERAAVWDRVLSEAELVAQSPAPPSPTWAGSPRSSTATPLPPGSSPATASPMAPCTPTAGAATRNTGRSASAGSSASRRTAIS
ncbi:LamG-like jellyroll fold domain-containing protein [Streptomyces sp. M10(2022)]